MSIESPAVVPLAVVTAITVFLLRELFEAFRRSRANSLKLGAIKALLAAECERNHYTHTRLSMAVNMMEETLKAGEKIVIMEPYTGKEVIRFVDGDGSHSGFPIPKVRTEALEKYLFETASLDRSLFQLMRTAQDELAEMQHIRDGIIKYPTDEIEHLDGFVPYAKRELEGQIEPIRALYFQIEHEPLTKTRIR